MKVYSGKRLVTGEGMHREITVIVQQVLSHGPDGHGLTSEPNLRRARRLTHIPYHSPDGFQWGYAGSGPADLAIAILADYFGESPPFVLAALRSFWSPRSKSAALHQPFKEQFIAGQHGDEWQLLSDAIEAWLQTPSIRARLEELAQEDDELAEIRQLDEEAKRGDTGVAH